MKTLVFISILLISGFGLSQHNALHFDGSNDYVRIDTFASVMNGLDSFTIEFWMNAANENQTAFRTTFMSINTQTGTDEKLSLQLGGLSFQSGLLVVRSDISVDWEGSTYIADNECHHIAFTYQNDTAVIYIDSVYEDSIPLDLSSLTDFDRVSLGQEWDGTTSSQHYNGMIDEFRVWNRALSLGEIKESINLKMKGNEPGLLLNFRMDQGVGGANNAGITSLKDFSKYDFPNQMINFQMNGITSNFIDTICNIEDIAYVIAPDDTTLCMEDSIFIAVNQFNVSDIQWVKNTFDSTIVDSTWEFIVIRDTFVVTGISILNGDTLRDTTIVRVFPNTSGFLSDTNHLCDGQDTAYPAYGAHLYDFGMGISEDSTFMVDISDTTEFFVTVYDTLSFCVHLDSVILIPVPSLQVDLEPDTIICDPSDVTFRASGAPLYNWGDGHISTTDSTMFIDSTSFIGISYFDQYGCGSSDQAIVVEANFELEKYESASFCPGDSASYFFEPYVPYQINNQPLNTQPNGVTLSFNNDTILNIQIIGQDCSKSKIINVVVKKPLNSPFSKLLLPCEDGLSEIQVSPQVVSTNWGNGYTTVKDTIIYVSKDSILTIDYIDQEGCEFQYTFALNIQVPTIDGGDDFAVCPGETIQFTPTGGVSYRFTPNLTSNGETQVFENTTFIIEGTDIYGCVNTDTVEVVLDFKDPKDVYPEEFANIFTPNGDQINDLYTPFIFKDGEAQQFFKNLEEISFFELNILNRWGAVVFNTDNPYQWWGGSELSGRELNEGTYFVKLRYRPNCIREEDIPTFTFPIQLER